jgi:hypothetical protein
VPGGGEPEDSAVPRAETESEGQELYLHFFHERLRREGLAEEAREDEWMGQFHLSGAHLRDDDDEDQATAAGDEADGFEGLTMNGAERHGVSRRRKRKESMNLSNFQVWLQDPIFFKQVFLMIPQLHFRIRCGARPVGN